MQFLTIRDINELLKKLYTSATMEEKDATSKVCRIYMLTHCLVVRVLKQWRKQCETCTAGIIFTKLQYSVSLLVQPELLSKQITIIHQNHLFQQNCKQYST